MIWNHEISHITNSEITVIPNSLISRAKNEFWSQFLNPSFPIMEDYLWDYTLLSISEVARRLRISKSNVYKLIEEGRLGFIQVSHQKRIPLSEVKDFIKRSLTYFKNDVETYDSNEESNNNLIMNTNEIINKVFWS